MLVINGKKLLAIYDEKYCDDVNPSKCIYFDLEANSKENFVLPDHRVQKGDAAFSRDGKQPFLKMMEDLFTDTTLKINPTI